MKYLILICALIFSFLITNGQLPLLEFSTNLSSISNDQGIQRLLGLGVDGSNNLYMGLNGSSSFDIGLGDIDLLIGSNNPQVQGAVAKFSNDQFVLGGFGYSALGWLQVEDQSFFVRGLYDESSNFNFSSEAPINFLPPAPFANRFFSSYDLNGQPNWILSSGYSFWDYAQTTTSIVTAISTCSNCGIWDGIGNYSGVENVNPDIYLVQLDLETGQLLEYKHIDGMGTDRAWGIDECEILDEFTISIEIDGNADFQWQGLDTQIIETQFRTSGFVTYNSGLECTSLIYLKPLDFDPIQNRGNWVEYDENGNMYCLINARQGDYELNVNQQNYPVNISTPYEFIIIKFNPEKEMIWLKKLSTEDYSLVTKIFVDSFGFVYFFGSYNNSLYILPENLSIHAPSISEAGFLSSFSPDGDPIWLHSISTTNSANVYDLVVDQNRQMYIGGMFTMSGTDFDFSSNVLSNLGIADGEDAFIAKYQLPEITPDLFVSKRYEGVGVSEDGQADLIRLRLSRVPESSVTVELTPDAQVNLGNGVGIPIILEFAADQSAILEQVVNIDALNDLVVEGLHTGLISISMTSADPAFNNLSESPISVSIIDNDVMSVEERNEFGFSISPNPASNFIDITCSQKPEGISLIEIIDIQGKKAYSQNFVSNTTRIDLSQFSNGTYSVLVRAEDRVIWREGVIIR